MPFFQIREAFLFVCGLSYTLLIANFHKVEGNNFLTNFNDGILGEANFAKLVNMRSRYSKNRTIYLFN